MTDTVNRGQRMADGFKDLVKDLSLRLKGEWFRDGFEEAARVSTGLLADRIEDLHQKNRSGMKLTQPELHLLTTLTDMRVDMERALQEAFHDHVRP